MAWYEIMSLSISAGALAVSVLSFVSSSRTKSRQLDLEEAQKRLAEKQFERIQRDEHQRNKADVIARIEKNDKGNHCFVIENKGPAVAHDIHFRLQVNKPDEQDPIINSEYDKLPYDPLECGQNFILRSAFHNKTPQSFRAELHWTNADGSKDCKKPQLSW